LGEFNLGGIPPAAKSVPQIEVTLDVDANGILTVSAKDKGTGKENTITIKANSGLSDKEIQEMIKDAELNAESDKKLRELLDQRNSAERLIGEIEKDNETYGSGLTEEEKTALNEKLSALKESIKGEDLEAMRTAVSEMYSAWGPLTKLKSDAEKAKKEAEEAANGEASTTESTAETVDAEVKEANPETKA